MKEAVEQLIDRGFGSGRLKLHRGIWRTGLTEFDRVYEGWSGRMWVGWPHLWLTVFLRDIGYGTPNDDALMVYVRTTFKRSFRFESKDLVSLAMGLKKMDERIAKAKLNARLAKLMDAVRISLRRSAGD